MIIEYNGILIY